MRRITPDLLALRTKRAVLQLENNVLALVGKFWGQVGLRILETDWILELRKAA